MQEGEQEQNWVMTAREVCRLLRIGRNTLYGWCYDGVIPHKRVKRRILFPRKSIQEWLENQQNGRRSE